MGRDKQFYIYAVQIGANEEVLYVNFSYDVDESFEKFMRKHPQIKDSKLRPDLIPFDSGFKKSKEAVRVCTRIVTGLEMKGFEVIAGGPVMNNFWSLYIIELDGNPKHLYVGQTNYPIQKRYQQHIYKFNPARILLHTDNFALLEEMCAELSTYRSQKEALEAEEQLANELRSKGYLVEGGH